MDKYDYLQRDSMYSGTKISVDVKRIFPFVKVGLPCCGSCMLHCSREILQDIDYLCSNVTVAGPLCALCVSKSAAMLHHQE